MHLGIYIKCFVWRNMSAEGLTQNCFTWSNDYWSAIHSSRSLTVPDSLFHDLYRLYWRNYLKLSGVARKRRQKAQMFGTVRCTSKQKKYPPVKATTSSYNQSTYNCLIFCYKISHSRLCLKLTLLWIYLHFSCLLFCFYW